MTLSSVLAGLFLAATPIASPATTNTTEVKPVDNAHTIALTAPKKDEYAVSKPDFSKLGGGPGDACDAALDYPASTFGGATTEADCLSNYVAKQNQALLHDKANEKTDGGTTFYWSKGYIVYQNATEAGTFKTDLSSDAFKKSNNLVSTLATLRGPLKAGSSTVADGSSLLHRLNTGDNDQNGQLIVVQNGKRGLLQRGEERKKDGGYWWDLKITPTANAGAANKPVVATKPPAKPAATSGYNFDAPSAETYDNKAPFKAVQTTGQALRIYKQVLIDEQGGKVTERKMTLSGKEYTLILTKSGRLIAAGKDKVFLLADKYHYNPDLPKSFELSPFPTPWPTDGLVDIEEGMEGKGPEKVEISANGKTRTETLEDLKKETPATAGTAIIVDRYADKTPANPTEGAYVPSSTSTYSPSIANVKTKQQALDFAERDLLKQHGGNTGESKTLGDYTLIKLKNGQIFFKGPNRIGILEATVAWDASKATLNKVVLDSKNYEKGLIVSEKADKNQIKVVKGGNIFDPVDVASFQSQW